MENKKEYSRYDIVITPDSIIIRKWLPGWSFSSMSDEVESKPTDFDLETALKWFEGHGYVVRRWAGGARIWKGKPTPVREGNSIIRLRKRLADEVYRGRGVHPRGLQVGALDLAFDL